MTQLYKQVPVLDSGARGATTTFVQKKIGDVHLAWENEAQREVRNSKGTLQIVYPPVSIRAEPHVAARPSYMKVHGFGPGMYPVSIGSSRKPAARIKSSILRSR